MAIWPASIEEPTFESVQDYGDNTIRTDTDSPVAKVRRRFTLSVRPTKATTILRGLTERTTFDDWFVSTIGDGSLEFELADPHSGVTYNWRFLKSPTVVEYAKSVFRVSMELERLTAAQTIPRTFSGADVYQTLYAPSSDVAAILLLTIEEDTLPAPIRVCHNTEAIVSRGDTYLPMFFGIQMPTDDGHTINQLRLQVDAIDGTIVEAVRAAVGRPSVTIEMVLSDDYDTVEYGPHRFELDQVDIGMQSITATAIASHGLMGQWPRYTRDAATYPSIFA